MTNLLRIRQKLIEPDRHGRAGQIAVSHFVHAVDQISSLLKFDGEEVSRRVVDALDFNALRISSAGSDLIRPESETVGIGIAVQEVSIMLSDEELGAVNRIRAR